MGFKKTPLIIFLSLFLLSSISTVAFVPRTVRGYVYVNDVITKPDDVILSIAGENISATLFDDGYYIIDFSAEDGETGIFTVIVDGEDYLANETLVTEHNVYVYYIDLHVWTSEENHPPDKPSNPSPANGSTGVEINVTLSWQCSDPDGDNLTYDVYFGTSDDPPKVSSNQSATTYNLSNLQYSTTYYWKIVAWDEHGEKNESELWTFVTEAEPSENHPPDQPCNPSPKNNETDVPVDVILSWQCSDPDGDNLTYDVYFGTGENQLKKVSGNQSSTTYKPSSLNYSTTYYWKIVAWDEHGESSESPVWRFTTEEGIPNSPPTVSITRPKNLLYFRDIEILSLSLPLIIGPITIEVNASDSDGVVKRVDFYIDYALKYSDTTAPFSWRWDSRAFGFKVIEVVAYDDKGAHQRSIKEVLIFNPAIL